MRACALASCSVCNSVMRPARLLAILWLLCLCWHGAPALAAPGQDTAAAIARLKEKTGIKFGWSMKSPEAIHDAEARFDCARRIHRNHSITFDWSTSTLSQLTDAERRIEAAKKIKALSGVALDWRQYDLSTLEDHERRADRAKEIASKHETAVDWRQYSLVQLGELETRLEAAKTKYDYGWVAPSTNSTIESASRARASEGTSLGIVGGSITMRTPRAPPLEEKREQAQPEDARTSSSNNSTTYSSSPTYRAPTTSSSGSSGYYNPSYRPAVGDHWVSGYYRSDGTHVQGHYRTNRDDSFWNNYSSAGNVNPYTGAIGTKLPPFTGYSSSRTRVSGYTRSDGTYVSPYTRSR